ncbi:recombinase family protein [Bradyrhizobium sp. 190]|uniref:recombinase family protein n=1 Tax=Bradyrhizobium sp. 190 TaxID=2782658 RepID=UPI001FF8E554|nr:recombinase family protein [Bradyrhizobium sp. 190]MCK1513047.1 recombinase family protein [Bradyrhizobium sp. 190]
MAMLGYARVSTHAQVLDIQELQLRAEGCSKIYAEKESGISPKRPMLKRLLRDVRPGDVIVFAALDRLTREGPYRTLATLESITSRGATYRSLAEPWADTTTELGEVLAALVGYIARKTRQDIIRRTSAGRQRAREAGVQFGRRPKLTPQQQSQALSRRLAGEHPDVIAESFKVSASTILRIKPKPS